MRSSSLLLVALLTACSGSADKGEDTPHTGLSDDTGATSNLPEDWEALPSATAEAMQAKLDQAVSDLGLTGVAMGFADGETHQLWVGTSGWADTASPGVAWTPERSFHIGSVTKTFTAAVVFQLQSEGVLSLDDPLDDWVPGYYDGEGITLRHLLAHTSGIVSYNYVGSFNDDREWEPEELVAWAVSQEPELRFEPGTAWEYSNTNFVLLGLTIEAATGGSYEEAVQSRLLDPLDLDDSYLAQAGNTDDNLVSCYDADGTDLTGSMDPSMGWAAGAMVSTPADLVRWGDALYSGTAVLDAEALEEMTTQLVLPDGTTVDYGLGAFVERDGDLALYGHTGGYEGYLTYMYHWVSDDLTLVVMSNQQQTDLRALAGYGWAVPLDLDYP